MYCAKCGNKIENGSNFCENCGHKIGSKFNNDIDSYSKKINDENSFNNETNDEDRNSIVLNIISFILPLVGIIVHFVLSKRYPKKANGIGFAAMLSILIRFFIFMCYYV